MKMRTKVEAKCQSGSSRARPFDTQLEREQVSQQINSVIPTYFFVSAFLLYPSTTPPTLCRALMQRDNK